MQSRGYRNNNPGNIIKGKSLFLGEVQGSDSRFRSFQSMEYGYRAIFKLLKSYIRSGYNTIGKIINRYAPPVENDTNSYVSIVEKKTGISKDKLISSDDADSLIKIVSAISTVENGVSPDQDLILKGWKLLGEVKKKT
jgi:hypothetical protein